MLHTQYSPDRLRDMRRRALLSQPEVTRATGISQATLSRIECGKGSPRTRTLRLLLSLYETRIRSYEAREQGWEREDATPAKVLGGRVPRERRVLRAAVSQSQPQPQSLATTQVEEIPEWPSKL